MYLVPVIVSEPSTDNFILVTDSSHDDVFMYSIKTSEVSLIPIEIHSSPIAIAYNHLEQKIYWTDVATKQLRRASLDGTGQEVLLSLSASTFRSLT